MKRIIFVLCVSLLTQASFAQISNTNDRANVWGDITKSPNFTEMQKLNKELADLMYSMYSHQSYNDPQRKTIEEKAIELIDKGAYIEITDYHGENRTPLGYATMFGYPKLVNKLVAKKANINSRDYLRRTPLMKAIDNKYTPIPLTEIENLIKNGADVNASDLFAETVLVTAVRSCVPERVELLIKYGADVNLTPENLGHPPKDKAIDVAMNLDIGYCSSAKDKDKIIEMLKKAK